MEHVLLLCFIAIWTFACPEPLQSDDKQPTPVNFMVRWFNNTNEFKAGDFAKIEIECVNSLVTQENSSVALWHNRFTIIIGGRKGNSSFISGVSPVVVIDNIRWDITFIPIAAGKFQVGIIDGLTGIMDQSLHCTVEPGKMCLSVCTTSWMNAIDEFVAGATATVLVMPKDAFGNNITLSSEELPPFDAWTISILHGNGSLAGSINATHVSLTYSGYISIKFIAIMAGKFLLHIESRNQTTIGTSLSFMVEPGSLNVSNCLAKWKYETNALQIFSKAEVFIYQRDQFGNSVDSYYEFDAQIVHKATNLSVPIGDLQFEEVANSVQLLSFGVPEPGKFVLKISDAKLRGRLANMQLSFVVFVGYCHGFTSVFDVTSQLGPVAGKLLNFSIYLQDAYGNPSPIEIKWLHVHVQRRIDQLEVKTDIVPGQTVDGPSSVEDNNNLGVQSGSDHEFLRKNLSSAFNVLFVPEKSGSYEIYVFCGNIPLNNGQLYITEIYPDAVDTSLSAVTKFSSKIRKNVRSGIVVQLVDKFLNPVTSNQEKIGLSYEPVNSSFLTWAFEDWKNGSYVGYYLAKDTGNYQLCASFEGEKLAPCPIEVNAYEREYFPEAFNDTVVVWENESIAFDVLQNDRVLDGSAVITELKMPNYGSLLRYGSIFRYTPFKGFISNDSFSYKIHDINQNVAIGTVTISVLSLPPQFVYLPAVLEAQEDAASPRFGDFSEFMITYSDTKESISLNLSTLFGTLFLAPMPLQIWRPLDCGFSVDGSLAGKSLILIGCVDALNSALQQIQYIGDENFYGEDTLTLIAMNKFGVEIAEVPIIVKPVNDAPYVYIPEYIFMEIDETTDNRQIFDKHTIARNFSIGDPDFYNFPDNKSLFVVMLSLEVSSGILITTLPTYLIKTTELMLDNSYQWQPVQTFVSISNHFVVKGKGLRFRGNLQDCDSALQNLLCQGTGDGAILFVTLNDMGNYGCYPAFEQTISSPLLVHATTNLLTKKPLNHATASLLGILVIIQFVAILFLGMLLLQFTCRCVAALRTGKRWQ